LGHRCPVPLPVGGQGAPDGAHVVWLGW
jgi:hypothetical protein